MNGETYGDDELSRDLRAAFGEEDADDDAFDEGENAENAGETLQPELPLPGASVAPAPATVAPQVVTPAVPPAPVAVPPPSRPVVSGGARRWVVPILAGDVDAIFEGPFYRVDADGAPLLDLHEYVCVQDAANREGKWERGPHLEFVSHDVDEAQILDLMGPGHYLLALRNASGRFIRTRSISVGRVAPIGRQARLAGAGRRLDLGGVGGATALPNDEPPAWAKAIMADMQQIKTERAAPRPNPLVEIKQYAEHLREGVGALREAQDAMSNVLGQIAPAPPAAPSDEEEEAEPDFVDGVMGQLGGIASNLVKAKDCFEQVQMVFGAAQGGS